MKRHSGPHKVEQDSPRSTKRRNNGDDKLTSPELLRQQRLAARRASYGGNSYGSWRLALAELPKTALVDYPTRYPFSVMGLILLAGFYVLYFFSVFLPSWVLLIAFLMIFL